MLVAIFLASTLLDMGPYSEVLVPDYNDLVSNEAFSNAVNAVAQTPIGPSPEWDKKADATKDIEVQTPTNSWWNVDYVVSNGSDTPITNYYENVSYLNIQDGIWALQDNTAAEPVYGTLLFSNLWWGCSFNSTSYPVPYLAAPLNVEQLDLKIDGSDDTIHLTRYWLYTTTTNTYPVVYENDLEAKADQIKPKTEFQYEVAKGDNTDIWFWEWGLSKLFFVDDGQTIEKWQSELQDSMMSEITISMDGSRTNCTMTIHTVDGDTTNLLVQATRDMGENPIFVDFGALGPTNFVFHRCASVEVSTNYYASAYMDDINRAMSYAEVLFGMSTNVTAHVSCWSLIPENGDYHFGNQYFKLGETMFAAHCEETVSSFVNNGQYFVALQLDYSGNATLVGFSTVDEMISSSSNPAFVIKPLYQFSNDMQVICDFRTMPQAQVIEVLSATQP